MTLHQFHLLFLGGPFSVQRIMKEVQHFLVFAFESNIGFFSHPAKYSKSKDKVLFHYFKVD